MGIEVTNQKVIENLIRFKNCISSYRGRKSDNLREYKVLVDCKTGEMNFAKKISDIEQSIAKQKKTSIGEWKEVKILVRQQPDTAACEIQIQIDGVEGEALRVVKETERVLNQKMRETEPPSRGALPEEAALRDLSSIQVVGEHIRKLPGWVGSKSRMEAETLLKGKAVGTYVIRSSDEDTSLMIRNLPKINIEYCIVTYADEEEKISEYLVLKTDSGWIVYRDDPILDNYKAFPSPEALIHDLAGLKTPLRTRGGDR